MQMLADLTGMTLEISHTDETGAFGAAMVAMVGSGEYSSINECVQTLKIETSRIYPNKHNYERYQRKYKNYQRLVQLFKQFEEQNNA
jgi:L-xylulokinase